MSYRNYETNYLISLLSSILNKRTPPDPAYAIDWRELFYLAEFHDVTNIAGYALIALYDQVPELWKARFNKVFRKWVTVDNTQQKEFRAISDALEDEDISFMVLRGWMMKRYYPQMDMRAVEDIELLVKPGNDKRLKELMRELGYRLVKADDYGMLTYQKGSDCHVCLHDKILPENRKLKPYFAKIWKKAEPIGGFSSRHSLEIDDFYIYMIAEICDRYARGDVDVRDILDIHLFVKKYDLELNWTYIEGELNKLELGRMASFLEDLGRLWIGVYEGNERSICEAVEDYVWSKGASGRETSIRLLPMIQDIEIWEIRDQRKKHFHEVMRRLFPKSEEMLGFFPTLAKIRLLMPILWIIRLIHMGIHGVKLRVIHFFRSIELRRREKQLRKHGKGKDEETPESLFVPPLLSAVRTEKTEAEEKVPDLQPEPPIQEETPMDAEEEIPEALKKDVKPVDISAIAKIAKSFNAVRITTIAEIQNILKHDKHESSEPEDRLIDHGRKEDEQFRAVRGDDIPPVEEDEEEELVDPMWVAKTTTNPDPGQEPKVIKRWKPAEVIRTESGVGSESNIVRPWKPSEGRRAEYTEEDVEAAKAYVTSPNHGISRDTLNAPTGSAGYTSAATAMQTGSVIPATTAVAMTADAIAASVTAKTAAMMPDTTTSGMASYVTATGAAAAPANVMVSSAIAASAAAKPAAPTASAAMASASAFSTTENHTAASPAKASSPFRAAAAVNTLNGGLKREVLEFTKDDADEKAVKPARESAAAETTRTAEVEVSARTAKAAKAAKPEASAKTSKAVGEEASVKTMETAPPPKTANAVKAGASVKAANTAREEAPEKEANTAKEEAFAKAAKTNPPAKMADAAKEEASVKAAKTAKANSPAKAAKTAKADSPAKAAKTAKAEALAKATVTTKAETPAKATKTAKAEAPAKETVTTKAEAPVKAGKTAKADSPSKARKITKAEAPAKAAEAGTQGNTSESTAIEGHVADSIAMEAAKEEGAVKAARTRKSVKTPESEESADTVITTKATKTVKARKPVNASKATEGAEPETKAAAKAKTTKTTSAAKKTAAKDTDTAGSATKAKTVSRASRTSKKAASDIQGNLDQDGDPKTGKAPKKRILVDDYPLDAHVDNRKEDQEP